MENNLRKKIRNFIIENFLFGEAKDFLDTDSLLEKGIIDSTGVLELVTFLEEEYRIKIEDDELVPENLDSISNITNFIMRKINYSVIAIGNEARI